jgi:uncharacterized protein (TIGR02996 family)
MTDRETLLRGVSENPDDDAPRLVYADWLDEHGDPRQAEFIRVQIQLAQVPESERPSHPLTARESALWRELRKWRYVIGDWRLYTPSSFNRGFVNFWTGTVSDFLMAEADFWRKGPIQILNVEVFSPAPLAAIARIAASPVLGRMKTVRLRGLELTDDWVAGIVASPHAGAWRFFEALGPRLTDRTCEVLAGSTLAASPCTVYVSSTLMTPQGLNVLERAFGSRLSTAISRATT